MKRTICLLVSLFLLIGTLPAGLAAAEGGIDENFEDVAVGELPEGWTSTVEGDGASAGVAEEAGGKAIKLTAPGNTKVRLQSPVIRFDRYEIGWRFKTEDPSVLQQFELSDDKGIRLIVNANNLGFRDTKEQNTNGNAPTYAGLAANTWYDVKFVIDNPERQVEFWFHGQLLGRGNYFCKTGKADKLTIRINEGNTKATALYLDDFRVEPIEGFPERTATFDFNSAQSGQASTFYPADASAVAFADLDASVAAVDIVSGQFGKAADDRSMYIHNQECTSASRTAPYVNVDLTKAGSGVRMVQGETAVLDMNLAFDEGKAPIHIRALANSDREDGGNNIGLIQPDMLILFPDGRLQIFGTEYRPQAEIDPQAWLSQWHRIRLEMTAGDNSSIDKNLFSLWLDGEQLVNEAELAFVLNNRANPRWFRGLTQLWITHNFKDNLENGVYRASGFYVDDVTYTLSTKTAAPAALDITIAGVENGAALENQSELTAQIRAAGDNGVAYMEIYHNDELADRVENDSYTLSLTEMETGLHSIRVVAEDMLGNVSEKTIRFTVEYLLERPLYTEDFAKYTSTAGDVTLPSGMNAYSQRGYIKPHTVDSAHGVSMAIGMETANPSFSSGDRPYANIFVQETTGAVQVKFDCYFDKPASSDAPFNISFKQVGSHEGVVAAFAEGWASFGNTQVDCAPQTWYTCVLKINVAKHTFDVQFYSEGEAAETVAQNIPFNGNIESLWSVRLWGPAEDEVKTFMAVDNIVVTKIVNLPTITEIGNNGKQNGYVVDYFAKEIELYLSEAIEASSLWAERVTISRNGINIPVAKVSLNAVTGAIAVTLEERLKTNAAYEAVLSGDVVLNNAGKPMGRPVRAMFTTTHGDAELLSVDFSETGTNVEALCCIENNTEQARKVDLILAVWKDDVFVRAERRAMTLAAEKTIDETIGSAISAGETAEVYLWDCTGAWPAMLANQVFTYKK